MGLVRWSLTTLSAPMGAEHFAYVTRSSLSPGLHMTSYFGCRDVTLLLSCCWGPAPARQQGNMAARIEGRSDAGESDGTMERVTYLCGKCQAAFDAEDEARLHWVQCSKIQPGTSQLMEGQPCTSQSASEASGLYRCDTCGVAFSEPSVLDQHMPLCGHNSQSGWTSEKVWRLISAVDATREKSRSLFQMFPKEKKAFFEEQGKMFGISAESVRVKWNSLVTSYKRIKDNASGNKTGRGTIETWPFFAAMDDMLGSKPSVSPRFILESSVNKENVSPEPQTQPETKADTPVSVKKRIPFRRKQSEAVEGYLEKKLRLEGERLVLEGKRLELEEKRVMLLDTLVQELLKKKDKDTQ